MLSLTVDEVDWEEMVLSGKIAKMYLGQLDMYLKEKVGIAPKEIKGKGFTYDKKVDFIRKHVLKQNNNDTGVTNNEKSLQTMTTVTRPANSHNTAINIIPWSGSIKRHGIPGP